MQLADALRAETPLVHTTGRFLVDGVLTDTLDGEAAELYRSYKIAEYYRRWNLIR